MPQGPDLRQYLEQALQLGTLTRAQAQKMTKDLVREGQLAQERAQSYVDELVERSRKRTEGLVSLVRQEVKSQIASLGIATKEDIARLETRISQTAQAVQVTQVAASTRPSNPGPELPLGEPPAKKAAAKRATKKSPAKKATAKDGK
jgi:polyhydroxyalkanoate synthesis regulator phasin